MTSIFQTGNISQQIIDFMGKQAAIFLVGTQSVLDTVKMVVEHLQLFRRELGALGLFFTKIQALVIELNILDVDKVKVLTIICKDKSQQVLETINIEENLIIVTRVSVTAELDHIQMRFTIILVANGDLGIKRFLAMLGNESVITLLNKVALRTKVTFQLIIIPRADLLIDVIDNVFTDIITGIERCRESLRNTIYLADNRTFNHARSLFGIKGDVGLHDWRKNGTTIHTSFKSLLL